MLRGGLRPLAGIGCRALLHRSSAAPLLARSAAYFSTGAPASSRRKTAAGCIIGNEILSGKVQDVNMFTLCMFPSVRECSITIRLTTARHTALSGAETHPGSIAVRPP